MSDPIRLPSRPADVRPPEIASELETVASRVRKRLGSVTADVIEIGRELQVVRNRLPHGQFIAWVETLCGLSRRTAQLMMKAARWAKGKSESVTLLEPTTIYLLAAPSTPKTVADAVLSRAEAGEVIAPHTVKKMICAEKQTPEKECGRPKPGQPRHAPQEARHADLAQAAIDAASLEALMAVWTHADEETRTAFLEQIGASLTERAKAVAVQTVPDA